MNPDSVVCIIPALDAAPTIGRVIDGLRGSLPGALVVVVDDGSTDATSQVARSAGAATLRFGSNRGKGAALRAGIAAGLELGCSALITVDADGQHDPAAAPSLVAALATADLVIGARRRSGTPMPVGRRLTNRLSASAVARCVGAGVADAQSGYRAFSATVAREVRPSGDRYEFETEFLILAAWHRFRIAFVPVPTRYGGPVASRFRTMRDSARIVRTLWQYRSGAPR